ncbi:MAG: hypothetical protein ABR609_03960 [Acidimicrobiia bacterium]
MDWLRGTEWWPDLEGTVLALETSEEAPPGGGRGTVPSQPCYRR